MGTSSRGSALIDEAARLAGDGEIGNSDAIRLLQLPHSPEDLRRVLERFDARLTPEARSKLTLAALVPLPEHVSNQRFEPIFDRYRITGKTYTTASGTTVPNEIQYYNGEMVQIYGDCLNPVLVRDVLAGSGYQPMILNYRDGRQTAIAQFWAHNLTDTSLRPYNAMFIVVAAVRENAPLSQSSITAHDNETSSILSMLYGSFNPTTAVYENCARLYFVRLLDSTRVAIEVGRERMGTDKRPGSIDLTHNGRQIGFSVKDGAGRGVARITVAADDDKQGCLAEVAKAAATAGIPLDAVPRRHRIRVPERGPHRRRARGELAVAQRSSPSTAAGQARYRRFRLELRGGRHADQVGIPAAGDRLHSQCARCGDRGAGTDRSVARGRNGTIQGPGRAHSEVTATAARRDQPSNSRRRRALTRSCVSNPSVNHR